MRLIRFIIGIVLAPVALLLIYAFVRSLGTLQETNITELWFLGGFLSYIVLHFTLYKPVFIHVMAHEHTHALWTVIFGGKVSSINISGQGGNVKVDKANIVTILAPYFFPFYTVIPLLYEPWLLPDARNWNTAIIGFTLSFHVLLTLFSMKQKQSDFKEPGKLFSLTFILCVNILVIAGIFAAVSPQYEIMNFFNEIGNTVNNIIGKN